MGAHVAVCKGVCSERVCVLVCGGEVGSACLVWEKVWASVCGCGCVSVSVCECGRRTSHAHACGNARM